MAYEYAPALIHAGKKNRDMKDVYPGEEKKNMGNAVRTHLLEQKIAEGCGQNFTAYKVMMFLSGNAEGFYVSEGSICNRCCISERSYFRAKEFLQKKGWITCVPYKAIIVNFDRIYGDDNVSGANLS